MIITTILCICLAVACGILYRKSQVTINYNSEVEQENKRIQQENKEAKRQSAEINEYLISSYQKKESLTQQLKGIRENIDTQSNILQSLKATNKQLQADATDRASQFYKDKLATLTKELENQKNEQLQKLAEERDQAVAAREVELNQLLQLISEEQDKLDDLKAKQLAFVEAQQRAEEIEAQKDYYRMVLEEFDLEEIKLLRDLQNRFSRKDAIDKLIWETYYKTPYDLLMSHLFSSTTKVCGIYKITNLDNGQSYIGQSVDVRERMRQHIKASLSSAPSTNKLYQQMKKYGPENFTFEILEEVERGKLNERETYWIDFYKTKEFGMNGTRGGA